MAVRVKVCGVTSLEDARACVAAGVDAIGLNFWPRSVRRCDERVAREIVTALHGQSLFVGVFVDQSAEDIERLVAEVGLDCVQLHGEESPTFVQRFLPHAYKALRVRGQEVLELTRSYPGKYVLLDAYVAGMPGGTGAVFDWQLAKRVALERKLTLAGGLTPDNVAAAVSAVRPWCVDTASGVESAPGVKDHALIRAFVERARGA
ncbi:MAG: Phosphoribosylanthranilate isomerase [Myxococcaceae bacterium]|nr:Phosphoribosylanthranilate isomerase [Myxococcaceae bacterium]